MIFAHLYTCVSVGAASASQLSAADGAPALNNHVLC